MAYSLTNSKRKKKKTNPNHIISIRNILLGFLAEAIVRLPLWL
jgi:hypothetical protein